MFSNIISNEEQFEELRSLIGSPSERVKRKVISYIDSHCRDFIGNSPFLTMATANEEGECDVSPRGDAAGFVLVLDQHNLFIPERPGNKRMDSIQNILSNPHVGLVFFIPGLGETLRINGKAYIVQDQELLEKTAVNGRKPLYGIGIEVTECYTHCAKAIIRSDLWNPNTWLSKEQLPNIAKILVDHCKIPEMTEEQVIRDLKEGVLNRLY